MVSRRAQRYTGPLGSLIALPVGNEQTVKQFEGTRTPADLVEQLEKLLTRFQFAL